MTTVYVADTTYFITEQKPEQKKDIEIVTTKEVIREIKDQTSRYNLNREIQVNSVAKKHIQKTREIARETGDITRLSKTDLKLLGLARQLKETDKKPIIKTDDYSIQNVAQKMQIEYSGIKQNKIKKEMIWGYRCIACKREYKDKKIKDCPVCGSELEERIIKRKDIVDD